MSTVPEKKSKGELELEQRMRDSSSIEREERIRVSTRSLSWKERAFVAYYVGQCMRDKELAAEMAGFGNPKRSADLLMKMKRIRGAINGCSDTGFPRNAIELTRDGVLARYAEIVDFDKTRYMERFPDGSISLDLDLIRRDKMGHMIKSIENTRNGIKITFEDRAAALEVLAKYHGVFQNAEIHLHSHQNTQEITYVNDWRGREPEGDQIALPAPGPEDGEGEREAVQLGGLRPEMAENDDGDVDLG
jgi:hypothetical protein